MDTQANDESGGEERIIAAVCHYLDVDRDRVCSRARDRETTNSRWLLCYVLCRAGYSISHIGRLLARDHSSVHHGIRQVEQVDALAREAQRLVEEVLPRVREEREAVPPDTLPLQAVSHLLGRGLPKAAPLQDVQAVRAYVCGTLLARERVPAAQAVWGLCVIAGRPRVRAIVEQVLATCGLSAYRGLIDLQLQQAGMRRCG